MNRLFINPGNSSTSYYKKNRLQCRSLSFTLPQWVLWNGCKNNEGKCLLLNPLLHNMSLSILYSYSTSFSFFFLPILFFIQNFVSSPLLVLAQGLNFGRKTKLRSERNVCRNYFACSAYIYVLTRICLIPGADCLQNQIV